MADSIYMINKYPSQCETCGTRVPANGGTLHKQGRRWVVQHLSCQSSGQPEVVSFRTSGASWTQNRRGRCEDAPCCGCCTS
jgi:hypothetical protein